MKTDSKDNVRKPSFLVYLAVLSAQMGSISLGCTLGWSGPALADMSRSDSKPQLTNDNDNDINMKTWIGSSMTLGALFGGILCGFCIQFLGYKKTMILLGIPNSVGWILLSFGKEIWILILGRIITGACSGIILGVVPAYVTDVSTPNIRGMLGMAMNLFGVIGILYVDILLLWIPWNYTSLGPILPAALLSISMFFIPESPNWLMSKFGRSLRVVEALHRLRHHTSDIDKELDELEELNQSKKSESQESFSVKILLRQDVYKPILIGICLNFFQQFSGMNALQFYMADLFKDSGSSLKPEYAVITVNTAMLLATIVGGLLIDRLGRKILLAISGLCHMTSLAVLGYYYYKHRSDVNSISQISTTLIPNSTISTIFNYTINSTSVPETHETSVIPVICLVVFVTGFSLGYGPVIWIVISEICSSNTIGLVISFCSFICWLFTFIVTKEFEDISKVATKYGAYWIFCGCSALSVLFAIYLPETKGKTVEELQRILYPKLHNNNSFNKKQLARHEVTVL